MPAQEVQHGDIQPGESYRVAIVSSQNNGHEHKDAGQERESGPPKPPVEEGEIRDVKIEEIGDQGDGITRIERGFVVIIPDTDEGERVTIEITDVQENVAFAEVVERFSYTD